MLRMAFERTIPQSSSFPLCVVLLVHPPLPLALDLTDVSWRLVFPSDGTPWAADIDWPKLIERDTVCLAKNFSVIPSVLPFLPSYLRQQHHSFNLVMRADRPVSPEHAVDVDYE